MWKSLGSSLLLKPETRLRVFMIQGEPSEFTILNENVKNSNDNSLKD